MLYIDKNGRSRLIMRVYADVSQSLCRATELNRRNSKLILVNECAVSCHSVDLTSTLTKSSRPREVLGSVVVEIFFFLSRSSNEDDDNGDGHDYYLDGMFNSFFFWSP